MTSELEKVKALMHYLHPERPDFYKPVKLHAQAVLNLKSYREYSP